VQRGIGAALALFGCDSYPGVQAAHSASQIANQAPDVILAKSRRTTRPARFAASMQKYLSEQTPRVAKSRLDIVAV
jgi:hypothetical protein